ncbi:uncharacterized protein LOC110018541 [Phalaenopsis equestris]|uniref:uncharacterized protein LOC110018541 n=1 Tax=Phalaenopsis equestris TaxID=78828 RepID=UPI0009E4C191|nr:uncharacterized protein LOC110018541 [Phalaenopsis equestris]
MNFEKKTGEGECGYEAAIGSLKKVMAVVDSGAPAKQAMMWALTHVANKGDILTLLYVIPHSADRSPTSSSSSTMREEKARLSVSSLASLCKACRPEVQVEALVIRGPKLATVLKQAKRLKISVLVLSQTKSSVLSCLMMRRNDSFVEQCIEKAECLAIAVRKRSNGVGGYLVSTRCQRNFWLLA